jgi:hypothetical protein
LKLLVAVLQPVGEVKKVRRMMMLALILMRKLKSKPILRRTPQKDSRRSNFRLAHGYRSKRNNFNSK